jgi:hypothetical protein
MPLRLGVLALKMGCRPYGALIWREIRFYKDAAPTALKFVRFANFSSVFICVHLWLKICRPPIWWQTGDTSFSLHAWLDVFLQKGRLCGYF